MSTARRERVAPWAAAAVLLAGVGVVAVVWRPQAPPVGEVETPLTAFAPEVLEAVTAYQGPRAAVGALAAAISVLVPLAVAALPVGRRLVRRLAGPRPDAWWRGALVAAAVGAATSAALLPLAAWLRVRHDGAWGFRTQTAASWLGDWAMVAAGGWLTTAVVVTAVLLARRRWPRSWPFRLTVAGTALAALLVLAHPLVLQPLLLPTAPLEPGPTRDAVSEVAGELGLGEVAIHVGEASRRTTRANALVVGLGPTERVVLYDTLLALPEDQVRAVVAHELAHRAHRDLPRGVLAAAPGLLVGGLALRWLLARPAAARLAPRGRGDPRLAALLVAAVAVIELAAAPVVSGVSRRVEAAADHRARSAGAGVAAEQVATARTFVVRDLADPTPPVWLHAWWGGHPTPQQRIRAAAAAADAGTLPALAELRARERELAHPAIDEGPP